MYPSPVYLGLNFSEVLGFFMIISSQEFFALTVCHYLRFILVTYSHFPCASFGNFQFLVWRNYLMMIHAWKLTEE